MGFGPTPIADEIADLYPHGLVTASSARIGQLAGRVRVLEVAYAGNKMRMREVQEQWHACELELFAARNKLAALESQLAEASHPDSWGRTA